MSDLREKYRRRLAKALFPISKELKDELEELLSGVERIDRITVRPKSLESFLKKSENLNEEENPKYSRPLSQIQDQIGARVVTFYTDNLERVKEIVLKEFRSIEDQEIVPDSENEFGYIGRHFILLVPNSVRPEDVPDDLIPKFFELQIKTLFQHAWAEANHDLYYKTLSPLSPDQKKRIAFTAAQSWGADLIFNELQNELLPDKQGQ